jgi:hypothetical protein
LRDTSYCGAKGQEFDLTLVGEIRRLRDCGECCGAVKLAGFELHRFCPGQGRVYIEERLHGKSCFVVEARPSDRREDRQ